MTTCYFLLPLGNNNLLSLRIVWPLDYIYYILLHVPRADIHHSIEGSDGPSSCKVIHPLTFAGVGYIPRSVGFDSRFGMWDPYSIGKF